MGERRGGRRGAHGITRWLGADAGENAAADVTGLPIRAPGLLLLCTDGLWNYVATPEAIEQVVREGNECGADALSLARHLVSFAIAKGGHDNITAVVLRSEPRRPD